MKPLLFCSFLLLGAALAARAEEPLNQLTAAEKQQGWTLLFDGKDASASWRGYRKDNIPAGWVVEDGALVRKEKGAGDLITKKKYGSFELALDWKISEGGNSGLMFKVQETGDKPFNTGPELQLQDNIKGHDPQKAGWLYQFYAASVDTTKPVGEWNHLVLKCAKTANGTYRCEHWMNGTKYVEYEIGSEDWKEKFAKSKFAKYPDFAKAAEGHICLQDHGDVVAFRNLKIRELPEK